MFRVAIFFVGFILVIGTVAFIPIYLTERNRRKEEASK